MLSQHVIHRAFCRRHTKSTFTVDVGGIWRLGLQSDRVLDEHVQVDVVVQQDALDVSVADGVLAAGVAADQDDGFGGTGAERQTRRVAQGHHGIGIGAGINVEIVQGLRQLRSKYRPML